MKYDIHFCLISKQATPNLAPLLAPEFRPKKVILYVSAGMKKEAADLILVLKKHVIGYEQLAAVDPYDINLIQNQIIDFLDGKDDVSIALNVTGGTKPMAIAAQEAFRMAGKPVFYVNHENNDILFLGEQNQHLSLSSKVGLDDYLSAHGYQVKDEIIRSVPEVAKRQILTADLVRCVNAFSDPIKKLNFYAGDAKSNNRLETTLNQSIDDVNWRQMMNQFEDAGILKLRDLNLTFTDVASRTYANGGWLEEHVFGVVKDLQLQDQAINLEVMNQSGGGHSSNELDVAFLARNRLHLIECKVRNFKDMDKAGADALYKLDSLTALGGLNTKGMLVSYHPLRDADKQRAKDLQIKTIETEQIINLKGHLQNWIKK